MTYYIVFLPAEDWEDVDNDDDDDDYMEADDEDEAEEEMEEGSSEKAEPVPGAIPITDCLFCRQHSRSLSRNVAHMTKVHSFFLPDVEYLIDLRGLIAYLGRRLALPLVLFGGDFLLIVDCYIRGIFKKIFFVWCGTDLVVSTVRRDVNDCFLISRMLTT